MIGGFQRWLLWPSPDEERQRQELMNQMMEARGVDVAAAARVDGRAGYAGSGHEMPPLPG